MRETEKGKRMEQILATGVTREQLAEALWCAERAEDLWRECAMARGKTIEGLRKLACDMWRLIQEMHGRHSADIGVAPRMVKLHSRMIELGANPDEGGK